MTTHSRDDRVIELLEVILALLLHDENGQQATFNLLRHIERRIKRMANEVDRIESDVTAIGGAVDSAIALLTKLADLIRTNANDPVRLGKIADDLEAKSAALAAAVVANDPDATPPTP